MRTSEQGRFRVIVADPPWQYPQTGRVGSKGGLRPVRSRVGQRPGWYADKHTLTVDELCGADVPRTDDSCLFLWCPSRNIAYGLGVVESWGFKYKATFVWVKTNSAGNGLPGKWTGYWARMYHELLLFGITDDFKRPGKAPLLPSVFTTPHIGGHGIKPDCVYEAIQQAYEGPYLELFARKPREGWSVYGDEVEDSISIPEWDTE